MYVVFGVLMGDSRYNKDPSSSAPIDAHTHIHTRVSHTPGS